MRRPNKKTTFNFFNYKWSRVPQWGKETDDIYRKWYFVRYGLGSMSGLKKFLTNKEYILEAGCGLARDSKMFAEVNSKAYIVAVDQSSEALKVASKELRKFKNCSVVRGDITNFLYDHKFDFISCDQVVHHTPQPGKTIKHLFEQLNKGGIINFSLCKKKNDMRDLADDLIMKNAESMKPEDLWKFSEVVTKFAKALYDLEIKNVKFGDRKYENIQRFVHDNLFRAWYNPNIPFQLSVSSNYDWFSENPRFSAKEVKDNVLKGINGSKLLRFYEDDATISVSLQKD